MGECVKWAGLILRTWEAAVLRPVHEIGCYVVRRLGEIGVSCQALSW